MRIDVTAEDVKLGIAFERHPNYCAVARALTRMGFADVSVGTTSVQMRVGEQASNFVTLELPVVAQRWILNNPRRKVSQAKPFSFDLHGPTADPFFVYKGYDWSRHDILY